MHRKLDLGFWATVILITVIGTVGGVLFKSGTNVLGTIDFKRLLDIRISTTTLVFGGLVVFSVFLLFYSGYSLRGQVFAAEYLFTPIIFLALVMMALAFSHRDPHVCDWAGTTNRTAHSTYSANHGCCK